MTQLNTTRRARKPYRCDNKYPAADVDRHEHPNIKVGDTYARLALTPNDSDIGNTGWWVARYCRSCAEDRGYLP